ncbi:MAG: cytochrome c-type biogenesis protein CcmH [Chloroflexota bacterium]
MLERRRTSPRMLPSPGVSQLLLRMGVMLWVAVLIGGVLIPATQAEDLDVQTRSIAKRLQCPICESVSVADSPSELATQMRAVIRTRLEQGESSDQIVAYFVERYGEGVLVEPPRHGVGLIVWLGPLMGLILGGVALALWFRRARPETASSDPRISGTSISASDWRMNAARRELEELGGRRSP